MKSYPYLGRAYENEKMYVVLFLEKNYGVVVLNETNNSQYNFGTLNEFDESKFDYLPPEECVRLSN